MRLVRDYRHLPESDRGGVAAIGNFDGVHRGHQAILRASRDLAQKIGQPAIVMTFDPHPRRIFQPQAAPFQLTSLAQKVRLLGALGIKRVHAIPFDRGFANLSAKAFIDEVLVAGLALHHVVVGPDFHFGKDRTGTLDQLHRAGEQLGFGVTVLAAQAQDGEVISSTWIREYLQKGQPRAAADLLGRNWAIEGQVITGEQRGRTLGFPTANLTLGDYLHPTPGVYAVRVRIEEGSERHPGVANFGRRPTFGAGEPLLEVHLLDLSLDLYERHLEVEFVEFLRPEQTFAGLEPLIQQITQDAARARALLADPRYAPARPLSALSS